MAHSSRGPGRRPLTPVTRVRIPYALPTLISSPLSLIPSPIAHHELAQRRGAGLGGLAVLRPGAGLPGAAVVGHLHPVHRRAQPPLQRLRPPPPWGCRPLPAVQALLRDRRAAAAELVVARRDGAAHA